MELGCGKDTPGISGAKQSMKKVAYVENADPYSGIGYRAAKLLEHIRRLDNPWHISQVHLSAKDRSVRVDNAQPRRIKQWPRPVDTKSIGWMRLARAARHELATADLVHLTNQTISFVARQHTPAVIEVHDVIEYVEPQTWAGRTLARYLYSGITKASRVIAVSHYTAAEVERYFGIPASRIAVIPNGVSEDFCPLDNFRQTIGYRELLEELRVPADSPIILAVGSDHPRKNMVGAVQVFARLKQDIPRAIFIKVGAPGLPSGRIALLDRIDALDLKSSVRLIESVSTARLNELYNLADVLLFPSRYEGFGLPPLQAMACGTPVVASNATSIPEVVGDAAKLHNPEDEEGMAMSMKNILQDRALQLEMGKNGMARAGEFRWDAAATALQRVWQSIL